MTNSQTVASGQVVSIHFTLTADDGSVIDQSSGGDPMSYLHGVNQIVPGLENALTGKAVGEKLKVQLKPEEAYGMREDEAMQTVDRGMFPPEEELTIGLTFQAESPDSPNPIMGRIVQMEGDQVTVDFNHPLAGMNLNFDVEIVSLRAATDEEKSHGHAHGEGCEHDH